MSAIEEEAQALQSSHHPQGRIAAGGLCAVHEVQMCLLVERALLSLLVGVNKRSMLSVAEEGICSQFGGQEVWILKSAIDKSHLEKYPGTFGHQGKRVLAQPLLVKKAEGHLQVPAAHCPENPELNHKTILLCCNSESPDCHTEYAME